MTRIKILLLAALTASVVAGCASRADSTSHTDEGIPVRIAAVSTQQTAEPIHASGVLKTKEEMRLSFKVGGVIERIHVTEGMSVHKGQLLAALNPAEINSQVHQAQEAMNKAERDLNRARALRTDSVVTLEQFQDVATGYEVAKAALDIARFNQQYAAIIAPDDGVILKTVARENEQVSPGAPVLIMSSLSKGWIISLGVADRNIVRLAQGDSATVSLDAFEGRTLPATVTEIAAAASPGTGTYEVELSVRASGLRLVSGLVAKAEIFPRDWQFRPAVPIESLIGLNGDDASIFTLDDTGTKARIVPVKVGYLDGASMIIESGLDGIAQVITDGASYLRDGSPVTILAN